MSGVQEKKSLAEDRALEASDRIFEFFLNQLRLRDGVKKSQFSPRTGLPWSCVHGPLAEALDKGLLEDKGDRLVPTDFGWRFSNEIQALFLP